MAACVLLVVLAMLAVTEAALAQLVPNIVQPGREREQLLERRPVPRAQPGGPAISLPSTEAPPGAATTLLTIRRFQIVGATVYSDEQFAALYRDLLNRQVPLDAVYDLAKRITAMYGADGYVLSRAIVPPQDLSPRGAVIRIQVIEGYVSRVEWPREKLARYRDFFSDYTAKIVADRPVNIRTLERYLLLANDLPGLRFTTTLQASKTEQGASVLVVDVTEKRLEVNARFDNRGTVARGPYQFLIAPTVNNLAGMHESLTIVYAGVTDINELQFVAPSYRQVLNSEGLTAFINASYSWGRPGTDILRLLDYRTESTIVEGGFYSPIIRQRERNLTLTALAFLSDTYSRSTDMFLDQTDRLRGVRLRADGDIADSLNGINQFAITVSQGIDGLGSTSNNNPEASRKTITINPETGAFIVNAGKVNFTKIEGFVSRTQPLVWGLFSQEV